MQDTLKTLSISLCSSLCTALLVVACTAGADKMDDSSSLGDDEADGYDGDGDGHVTDDDDDDTQNGEGDDDGGLADVVSQVAEMATTIAAQQAAIVALELEMAQTLRWETLEHTCVADDTHESTGLTADGAVTASMFRSNSVTGSWALDDSSPDFLDGVVTVDCSNPGRVLIVTVGYER